MSNALEPFNEFVDKAKRDLNLHREIAFKVNCSDEVLEIFDKIISIAQGLQEKANQGNLKLNYLNQFQSNLNSILNNLQYRHQNDSNFIDNQGDQWKENLRNQIEQRAQNFRNLYAQLDFNLSFFEKIGFFNSNVVVIGANGSGKTTLSNKFKNYLQNNGVVISAQRILLVPNFDSISNPSTTADQLKQTQTRDKTNKDSGHIGHLQQEFGIVLKNLLAENVSAGNAYVGFPET